MSKLKTPLRYPGGKSRAAPLLSEHLPDLGEYRDPFMGGGSMALLVSRLYPGIPVWVNDKYTYLYNFWVHLQKDGKKLSDDLVSIKTDNSTEDKAKELFKDAKTKIHKEDPYNQAVLFWVLNKCSYSGLTENSSFSATASRQNFTVKGARNLVNISEIIKPWKITNFDYSDVMAAKGDNCLLYTSPSPRDS